MRILFLTQWFAPEPHFKGLPFARELQRRGHEVVVLTGFPNYPGGKLYPGYRIRPWRWETLEGVKVLRVALYPSHSRSALGRVLNYVSFAVSATVWGLLWIKPVDVAYVYHPPATIGLPALAFRWLRGVPCVYDVQDLWPDTLAATGMLRPGLLLTLVKWWSNFVYRRMDRVVVLSPGFRLALLQRGVKPEAVSVVYNWSPDTTEAGTPPPLDAAEERLLAGRFNVLFAGNMGPAQALETVIEAAALLESTLPRVQFVFVGSGLATPRLQNLAKERQLGNVVFLPRRPPEAMPALYAAVDALLVHLRDDPLFAITIPSKTQTYLAVGRPIIMAVRGDAAGFVAEAGAGVCCPPEDPRALAESVKRLCAMTAQERNRLGAAGRKFYKRHLNRRRATQEFEALFAALPRAFASGEMGPAGTSSQRQP